MWYLIAIPNQNRVGIVVIKVQVLLELDQKILTKLSNRKTDTILIS
jgi:hypothetical protein